MKDVKNEKQNEMVKIICVEFEYGYVYTWNPEQDVLSPRALKSWHRKLGKIVGSYITELPKSILEHPAYLTRVLYSYKAEGKKQKRFRERMSANQQAKAILKGQRTLAEFTEKNYKAKLLRTVSRRYQKKIKEKFVMREWAEKKKEKKSGLRI